MHTMVGSIEGAHARFNNPTQRVSAHYGIGLDGRVVQWVDEDFTAYHSGNYAMNQTAIGIEHEDKGNFRGPFTPELYTTSAKLVRDICLAYGLPINRSTIIGHKEVPHPTSCPNGLDLNKVIEMANNMVPVTKSVDVVTNQDEINTMRYFKEVINLLKQDNGEPFGNLEGMARALVDSRNRYLSLVKVGTDGKPPIIASNADFIDLKLKALNFDTVAAYFGFKDELRTEPGLGKQLVETIRELSRPDKVSTGLYEAKMAQEAQEVYEKLAKITGTTTHNMSNQSETVPNASQVGFGSSNRANQKTSLFDKLGQLYAKLFILQEGA